MAYYELAKEIFNTEKEAIEEVEQHIDQSFDDLVHLITNNQGRIVFVGIGKSEIIAQKIAASLSSIGYSSFTIDAAAAFHGDLGRICGNDIVIFISNSGETQEVIQTLFALKNIFPDKLNTVAFTGNINSTLAHNTDLIINLGVTKEADITGLAPTSSTTATLVYGDALLVSLEVASAFDEEKFALYHPGGNIGKMLLQKVKHVMHTNLPKVSMGTPVNDVIYTISSYGIGVTLVIDDSSQDFVGIVTDGDIRKKILQIPSLKKATAQDFMTSDFITINQNEPNQDAWKKMADYSISNLIVVNDNQQVIGIVTLHDVL